MDNLKESRVPIKSNCISLNGKDEVGLLTHQHSASVMMMCDEYGEGPATISVYFLLFYYIFYFIHFSHLCLATKNQNI